MRTLAQLTADHKAYWIDLSGLIGVLKKGHFHWYYYDWQKREYRLIGTTISALHAERRDA